jgi:tRNA A-37 threonylcarbamoyl transferase component Bud32
MGDSEEIDDEIQQMIDDFDREVHMQMIASDAGLAPHIWETMETDTGRIIIMDGLDGTLKQYILKNPADTEIYMRAAIKILLSLHQLNMYHGDAHLDNFMYGSNGRLYLIDFGESYMVKPKTVYLTRDFARLFEEYQYLIDKHAEIAFSYEELLYLYKIMTGQQS